MNNAKFSYMVNQFKERNRGVWDNTLKRICEMVASGELPNDVYDKYLSKTPAGFMQAKDIYECIKAEYIKPPFNCNFVFPCRFTIKKVIFNPPATIVLWSDGSKTVVKCQNEAFDREKGLAMAVAKKALGNRSNFNNEFKKWIDEDDGTIRVSAKVAKQIEDLLGELEKEFNVDE